MRQEMTLGSSHTVIPDTSVGSASPARFSSTHAWRRDCVGQSLPTNPASSPTPG